MKIIISKNHYAPFNIASEEYFFENFEDSIFLLYQNDRSVIVGRKQNALAEINMEYVEANNIPVVRRLSGGGAVFHDKGNLNFSFIIRNVDGLENDFSRYTQPIIDVLRSLGVNANLEGRNDLTIDGRKFSGNAKFFRGNSLIQHGTLLFDSNLSDVSLALKADPLKFQDKAVKSVRSRVTNISEHLPQALSMEEFEELIVNHILKIYPDAERYSLNDSDTDGIDVLVGSKYGNWDWNFGKSPAYNYSRKIRTLGGNLEVMMNVKSGIIEDFRFFGDFFSLRELDELENLFIGKKHIREDLCPVIEEIKFNDWFINVTKEDILSLIFE